MSRVFISHAANDGAGLANELVAHLERQGRECWIAPRDVAAGRTYPAQIMAAIRECRGLALLLTRAATRSADVAQEVQIAHTQRKVIIPIIVGGAIPSDDLAYFLAVRQSTVWTTPEAASLTIIQSLPAIETVATSSADRPMSALQAIEAAAASEDGVAGVFKIIVRSTGSESGKAWLSSEESYRDPRCLSIAVHKKARDQLKARYGEDPKTFLKDRIILVRGTARKQRIDFIVGGEATGHHYFQTHVSVTDADQIEIVDSR